MLLVSFISALSAYSCTCGSLNSGWLRMSGDTQLDVKTTIFNLKEWHDIHHISELLTSDLNQHGRTKMSCTCAEAAVKPAALAASRKLDPLSSLKVSRTSGFRKPVMPWLHSQEGRSLGTRTIVASKTRLHADRGQRSADESKRILMGVASCLPRHGMLNLDASSVVNIIHSMDFTGWKPWSLRNFTALIAPITPSAPS